MTQVVVLSPEQLQDLVEAAVRKALGSGPAPQQGPRWITMGAAAQRLGVHRSTLWDWVAKGTVPADRVLTCGRRIRIDSRWIDSR